MLCTVNCTLKKDENNEKEAGNGPFKQQLQSKTQFIMITNIYMKYSMWTITKNDVRYMRRRNRFSSSFSPVAEWYDQSAKVYTGERVAAMC